MKSHAATDRRRGGWAGLALAPALLLASPVSGAPAEPGSPPVTHVGRVDSYSFAFHEAEISQVADEILGRTLGLNFTVDPEVTGKISFRIDQRLTRAQLLEAFEAALGANGVVMVRNGDSLILTPRAKAKESASIRTQNEGDTAAGYEVVAVPLTFATPSEVAKALQSMGRGDMVVYTDDKLGLMLLGGSARPGLPSSPLIRRPRPSSGCWRWRPPTGSVDGRPRAPPPLPWTGRRASRSSRPRRPARAPCARTPGCRSGA